MAKKQRASKPDEKQQPAAQVEENPVSPEQPQAPAADATPALTFDPLLSPEAQQPGERIEDFERRVGKR